MAQIEKKGSTQVKSVKGSSAGTTTITTGVGIIEFSKERYDPDIEDRKDTPLFFLCVCMWFIDKQMIYIYIGIMTCTDTPPPLNPILP